MPVRYFPPNLLGAFAAMLWIKGRARLFLFTANKTCGSQRNRKENLRGSNSRKLTFLKFTKFLSSRHINLRLLSQPIFANSSSIHTPPHIPDTYRRSCRRWPIGVSPFSFLITHVLHSLISVKRLRSSRLWPRGSRSGGDDP